MTCTPYSQDDINVLKSLQTVTRRTMYAGKDKLREQEYIQVRYRTIDKNKQSVYEGDYLYRDALSSDEFAELEKANSYIYASFITHRCDYTDISFSKRLEIFNTLWQVVFGEKARACYLEITNDLPQQVYSIEIVRNFPNENRREIFSL